MKRRSNEPGKKPQRLLSEEDQAMQALILKGAHETLDVGTGILSCVVILLLRCGMRCSMKHDPRRPVAGD